MFPTVFNSTILAGTNGFSVPSVSSVGDFGRSVASAKDLHGLEIVARSSVPYCLANKPKISLIHSLYFV